VPDEGLNPVRERTERPAGASASRDGRPPSAAKSPRQWLRTHRTLVGLALLALALRLAYVAEIQSNPFFDAPYVDARDYDEAAWLMANGGEPPEAAYQAPLYPLFLSVVYRVFGHNYLAPRIVQAVLGSLSVFLTGWLAELLFGRRAGPLAALLAAVYWPFIFFEGDLLREPLAVHLTLWGLVVLVAGSRARRPRLFSLLAGLLFGLSALTRENILLFVPFAGLWLRRAVLKLGQSSATANQAAVAMVLGTLAAVLPISVSNSLTEGEFVFLSTQGGLNFYIGNHPDMRRLAGLQPGAEWFRLRSLPDKDGAEPTPARRSAWFYRETLRIICQQPLSWASRMLEKTWLFWSGKELMPNQDLNFYRARSWVLSSLSLNSPDGVFPFGLLGPLAIFGLIVLARKHETGLPTIFLGCFVLSVVLFHVRSRYRLPAAPMLFCLSAFALDWLLSTWRTSGWPAIRGPAAGFLSLVVLCNVSWFDTSWAKGFPTPFFLGCRLAEKGQWQEAKVEFDRALATQPQFPEVHVELGCVFHKLGKLPEAEAEFRKAIAIAPDYVQAMNNLALLQSEQGKEQEAEATFRRALGIDPSYTRAGLGLGMLLMKQARHTEAASIFREAARRSPRSGLALYHLGLVLDKTGKTPESVVCYERALRLNPLLLEPRLRLAEVYESLGVPNAAERLLREFLQLPAGVSACAARGSVFLALGRLYERLGRHEEAAELMKRGEELTKPGH
jgi:tetratricopeptide (TPR) repeat protein